MSLCISQVSLQIPLPHLLNLRIEMEDGRSAVDRRLEVSVDKQLMRVC